MSEKNFPAPKKVWFFAGEPSGDAYGAQIALLLKARFGEKLELSGMGGPQMRASGVEILTDSSALSVMGFWEVFRMIFTFLKTFFFWVKRAKKSPPDLVVMIDYPGFNLRLAQRLHKLNIPVVYYISPKVWAWGKGRIPTLGKVCKKVICIFPFEVEFFKDKGVNTVFTGHPLVNMIRAKLPADAVRDPQTFLLLPGSRSSEIKYLLPPMLISVQKLWLRHPELKFVIAASSEKTANLIQAQIKTFNAAFPENERPSFEVRINETYDWIARAGTALATSGTVTVECAIAGLPLVSIYASSSFNFYMAKLLVKLYRDFFTMPNIIMDRCVYEEYMQFCLHPYVLVPALERILPGGERREWVIGECRRMTAMLNGDGSNPIENAAAEIENELQLS